MSAYQTFFFFLDCCCCCCFVVVVVVVVLLLLLLLFCVCVCFGGLFACLFSCCYDAWARRITAAGWDRVCTTVFPASTICGALHPAIQALFILDADGLFAFRKVYAVNILLSKQTKTTTKLNHKKVRSNHSTESQTGFYFQVFTLIIVLFLLFVCLGEGLRHGTLRTFAWLLPSSGWNPIFPRTFSLDKIQYITSRLKSHIPTV